MVEVAAAAAVVVVVATELGTPIFCKGEEAAEIICPLLGDGLEASQILNILQRETL